MVDINEVAENIYMIDDQLYSIPKFGSVYLLNEEKKVLIDSGPTTSANVVLDGIRKVGVRTEDIAYNNCYPYPFRPCWRCWGSAQEYASSTSSGPPKWCQTSSKSGGTGQQCDTNPRRGSYDKEWRSRACWGTPSASYT